MHDEDWDYGRGHTPRAAGKLHVQYKKPCVTIQNHFLSKTEDGKSAALQRTYHWVGMMQKVQGLASYGYGKFIFVFKDGVHPLKTKSMMRRKRGNLRVIRGF